MRSSCPARSERLRKGTGEGFWVGGAGEATPVASLRQDGSPPRSEVQRPIRRRKGGEEDWTKGPTEGSPQGSPDDRER